MTTLLIGFGASGQIGVLGRRRAQAIAIAASQAAQIRRSIYNGATVDARLTNANANNDAAYADQLHVFASATTPTGNDAPDVSVGDVTVGNDTFSVFINVAADMDPDSPGTEQGRAFAVIVRYHAGAKYDRAVVVGYRYNGAVNALKVLPL